MRLFVGMVCFFIINSIVFSQLEPPQMSCEKFNERGYLSGDSYKARGNEVIGEYDGNLMLSYSLPVDLPNGIGSAITINYNANVDHVYHIKLGGDTKTYHVNTPAWIIGFNGFALQTLNFENNFFSDNDDDNATNVPIGSQLSGGQVPLLIEGYHYNNRIIENFQYQYPESGGHGYTIGRDYIKLLMADGSVKVLYNSCNTQFSTTQDYTLTGIYIEKGRNSGGIGWVDFIDAERKLRYMIYKQGDGLTYYFEEKYAKLNGRDYIGNIDPKVMYLEQISNSVGDTLCFHYDEKPDVGSYLYNSREVFTNLIYNKHLVYPDTYESVANVDYDMISINNQLLAMRIKTDKTEMGFFTDYNEHGNLSSVSRDPQFSKRASIIEIQDVLGRRDQIEYTRLDRMYTYDINSPVFSMSYKSPVIDNIIYHNGKKTEFEYVPHGYSEIDILFSEIYSAANMVSMFRDPYSNFMVDSRKVFENTTAVREEDYQYSFSGDNDAIGIIMKKPLVENIVTKIITINLKSENNSPSSITRELKYSRFRDSYYDPVIYQFGFNIKKLEEKTYQTQQPEIFTKKTSTYNIQSYVYNTCLTSQYYSGNFLLSSERNYEKFGSGEIIQKITEHDITEQPMLTPDNQDVKYFITNYKVRQDNGLWKETNYNNIIPTTVSDYNDPEMIYFIGMMTEEKVYSATATKSHVKNIFHEDGEFLGKLKHKIINPGQRQIVTTYDYYESGLRSKRGFLKSEMCNGVKKLITYPKEELQNAGMKLQLIDTVYRRTVYIDGTELSENYECRCWNFNNRHEYYIYGGDTLHYYYAYDNKGNLIFEVDPNGYLHEFDYDEIGRITNAKFPGSFLKDSQVDTIYQTFNQQLTIDMAAVITTNNGLVPPEWYNFAATYDKVTNDNSGQAPDGAVGRVPEEGYTPEVPGGGSGGGGSTPPETNFSYYYLFFDKPFDCSLIENLYQATFKIKGINHQGTDEISPVFAVKGVVEKFSGSGDYETIGDVTVDFVDGAWHENIDISSIFEEAKLSGKKIHGLRVEARAYLTGDLDEAEMRITFEDEQILPEVYISALLFDTDNTYLGGSLRFTYFDAENKAQVVKKWDHDTLDIKQVTLTEEYDAFGQPVISQATSCSGHTKTIAQTDYNYLGLKNSVHDGMNRMTASSYDYLSRPLETWFTATQNPKTTMTYGKSDIVDYFSKVTAEDECGKQVITYSDVYGNKRLVRKFIDAAKTQNADTKFDYNDLMQLVKVTSPENYETTYEYDSLGFLKKKITPHSGTTELKYDKFGNLRFQRNSADTSGIRFTFTRYDSLSRVIRIGTPASHILFENMDPDELNGGESDTLTMLVIHHFDNTGFDQYPVFNAFQTSGFEFNNLKGRIAVTAYRDKVGQSWNYKAYSYDHLGRVERMRIQLAGPQNLNVIFKNHYDNFGNLVKQEVGNFFYYWYEYDDFGRLDKVYSSMHDNLSTAKLEAEYNYNNADQVTALQIKGADDLENIAYNYDYRGRLNSIENLSLYLDQYRFKEHLIYADNSNITNQQIFYFGVTDFTNLYAGYSYDGMNRLTNVVGNHSETFTYLKDGRIDERTVNGSQTFLYGYNTLTTRLSNIKGIGTDNYKHYCSYDNRGNMIYDTKRGTNNMEYDFRNLPLTMQKGAETLKYRYDETGNRILKRAGGKTEYYVRDHSGREVGIYDKDDGWKSFNLFGNGLIGRADVYYQSVWVEDPEEGMVEVQQRIDERFYYIKDHLGSIRVTIDQNNNVSAAQDYSAYGEIWRSLNSSTPGDRYKFTEKELDIETGYSYFGARYYDSWRCTWNSVDPLEHLRAGLTPYNYCQNNPLNRFDPDGNTDFTIGDFLTTVKYLLSPISLWNDPQSAPSVVYANSRKASNAALEYVNKNAKGPVEKKQMLSEGAGAFVRHAYWSALNTKSLGAEISKEFTDAHEYGSTNTAEKKQKDLKANAFGIQLALDNPDATDEELLEMITNEANNRNEEWLKNYFDNLRIDTQEKSDLTPENENKNKDSQ